ncbi:hypothetical protein ACLB2K_016582 [Fragaria x ananassa]
MKPQKNCLLATPEFLGFLFLIAQFTSLLVQGDVHYYDFVVREKEFTKLCVTKSILVVNDSFPGPEIRVHKGDTVFVNVHNQGYYGFTIHWHGIKQPRNPWSDGPEYITQCPIAPGTNFTYEVQLSDEEGTLWWHAHSDWTRATVHGAIVILPAVGTTFPFPQQPDEDETLIIASWYFGDIKELVDVAMEVGGDLPHSDAYTINGEPGDLCECSKETTYRRMVDYGKTYLLRIVNANINAEHFFAVGGHNLTVVGLDGAYIKPINTGYIVISPGQAMDVLLEANQAPGQYYMAGRQYSSEDAAVVDFDHVNVTAILAYTSNYTYKPPLYPTTLPMYLDYPAAVEFILRIKSLATPEYPISVPLNVTTSMFIVVSMNELTCKHSGCKTDMEMTSSLNNISFAFPLNTTDVLQAYYRNISGVYTTDFPDQPTQYYNFTDETFEEDILFTVQGTKVKMLDYNETVQIVFQGTDVMKSSVNHPMHMHGYSFYVVGFGFGNYDNETDPQGFNLVDPPQVVTFGVPKNGWLAIRFTANNPGVWFWHCHFERHLSWGMNTAFIVKDGGTVETSMRQPPTYMPPCNVQFNSRIKINSTEGVNKII